MIDRGTDCILKSLIKVNRNYSKSHKIIVNILQATEINSIPVVFT